MNYMVETTPQSTTINEAMRYIQEFHSKQQFAQALAIAEQVLLAKPNFAEMLYIKGTLLHEMGEVPQAKQFLLQCLSIKPHHLRAQENLVSCYRFLGEIDSAMEICQQLINQEPLRAFHYFQLGALYRKLENYPRAIENQQIALRLEKENYSYHAALAMAYKDNHQYELALNPILKSLMLKPDHAENWGLLGAIAMELGQSDKAFMAFNQALKYDPQNDTARINRVIMLFANGEFQRGWEFFHERWLSDRLKPYHKILPFTEWHGQSLSGKSIRLIDEQGVGDGIMFASIIPYLMESGASVEYLCKAKLAPIFRRSFPDVNTIPENFQENCDYSCFIGDMPRGVRLFDSVDGLTELDSWMVPDYKKSVQYREELFKLYPGKILVGFSFYSKYKELNTGSTSLEDWLPVFQNLPQVQLINLQYDNHDAEIQEFKEKYGIEIAKFHVDNYMDIDSLASLIYALDCVITSENTNGHIAGALGRPCFMALARRCSWRWGWNSKQNWYQEHRQFRQKTADSWQETMEELRQALINFIVELGEFRENMKSKITEVEDLIGKEKKDDALELARKIFLYFPTMLEAEFYYASALQLSQKSRDALRHCAIITQQMPYHPFLFGRISLCHIERSEKEKAIAICETIIKNEKQIADYSWLFNNLSMQYMELGMLDKAEDILRTAVENEPENYNYIYNRSNLRMIERRFSDAWQDYEKRIYTEKFKLFYRPYPKEIKVWQGEDLTDKTLLIQSEQGVGEQIMFGQLIRQLDLSRAKKVVISCKRKLEPIFARSLNYEILEHGQGNEHVYAQKYKYDYYILMGSLPKMLNLFIDKYPLSTPFLMPDKAKVQKIGEIMHAKAMGKKIIGISWYKRISRHNSMGIENFLPFAMRDDTILVDLQYESTEQACNRLCKMSGNPMIRIGDVDNYNDIDDLCAIIKNCDAVVSIQNTTVHLAGGLGVPTHVLLPRTLDWRWSKDYDYGIWYPQFVHLYHQSQSRDWSEPIQKIINKIYNK